MIDPETCDFSVYADRTVVEHVEDPALEISLVDAQKTNTNAEIGDVMKLRSSPRNSDVSQPRMQRMSFFRKSVRKSVKFFYDQYYGIEKEVVTGIVQRVMGKNVSINLGKADAVTYRERTGKG